MAQYLLRHRHSEHPFVTRFMRPIRMVMSRRLLAKDDFAELRARLPAQLIELFNRRYYGHLYRAEHLTDYPTYVYHVPIHRPYYEGLLAITRVVTPPHIEYAVAAVTKPLVIPRDTTRTLLRTRVEAQLNMLGSLSKRALKIFLIREIINPEGRHYKPAHQAIAGLKPYHPALANMLTHICVPTNFELNLNEASEFAPAQHQKKITATRTKAPVIPGERDPACDKVALHFNDARGEIYIYFQSLATFQDAVHTHMYALQYFRALITIKGNPTPLLELMASTIEPEFS